MKIVYENPMQELKKLITLAATEPGTFVVITKTEMATIIRHSESRELFASYFARQDTRRQQIQMKLNESKKIAGNPNTPSDKQQEQWDRQTTYERQLRGIEEEVPTELRSANGVVIKTAMLA